MPQTATQNNGNRPKLELPQNQPVRLRLLKGTPFTGENARGKYYLYSVVDSDGIELAYFADEQVHILIQSNKLKTGSEIQLTKKGKAVEFAIIGQATSEPVPTIPASAHIVMGYRKIHRSFIPCELRCFIICTPIVRANVGGRAFPIWDASADFDMPIGNL